MTLIASIPFDVKELVLLDILPRKGLASADHHLRNSKIRWSDQDKLNRLVLAAGGLTKCLTTCRFRPIPPHGLPEPFSSTQFEIQGPTPEVIGTPMAGASLLALLDDIATVLDDIEVMTKLAARKRPPAFSETISR